MCTLNAIAKFDFCGNQTVDIFAKNQRRKLDIISAAFLYKASVFGQSALRYQTLINFVFKNGPFHLLNVIFSDISNV